MKASEEMTFEEALAELESIVQQLEAGELALEEMVSLYQRGQQLATHCQARLDKIELRVQQLQPDGVVEVAEITDPET
jgi:exodeoxyribonuclease VII small subunit